ncbi:CRISPR-associated exonuclease Cas4/endonuclease Cas1 fusion [Methylophilaceae bacterium]|nr:CRISPR-associated exonuclease Cas4/endonuclease Cas1 fusion [Methylophilaceae bacterium]
MLADDNMLMISALQHVAYCPRQFALIHVEQAWEENYFTAHGRVLHERVDEGAPEQRGNVRFERSVSVYSQTLGITGKLDLLEIEGKADKKYFPVEYKRGKPKIEDWDRIQLCAQALCLEEMRGIEITEGAMWYWQERRRERVLIDAPLREATLAAIALARDILASGRTPAPTIEKSLCKACSLVDICVPDTLRKDRSAEYVALMFE